MNVAGNLSLENVTRLGEKYYLDNKTKLEEGFMGQYAVIDVEKQEHVTNPDRLTALNEATTKFGDKLFYIVQIGSFQTPNLNFSSKQYAWNL